MLFRSIRGAVPTPSSQAVTSSSPSTATLSSSLSVCACEGNAEFACASTNMTWSSDCGESCRQMRRVPVAENGNVRSSASTAASTDAALRYFTELFNETCHRSKGVTNTDSRAVRQPRRLSPPAQILGQLLLGRRKPEIQVRSSRDRTVLARFRRWRRIHRSSLPVATPNY